MLVFIHPSGFTGEIFSEQLRAFDGSVAPNLPGHNAPGFADSVGAFATFIESYLEQNDYRNVVLCGNSLGGAVALEVGLRKNPCVAALALIGSGARLRVSPAILDGLQNDFEAAIAQLAPLLFAQPSEGQIAQALASMRRVGQRQTLADFQACNGFDVIERLGEISVPLLAVCGEKDVMTPPKYAEFLADRVPQGQVRIIPAAGHLVMAERPSEVNEALAQFVSHID